MAKVSNREIVLARVYANAILSAAEQQKQADSLLEEMLELKKFLSATPIIGEVFASPTMNTELRRQFIERTLRGRASDLLVDALQVMNRKDRLALFQETVEQYRLAHEELRGIVDVYVRTAVPLDDARREEIRTAARNYSGKEPALIESVDPQLLGGLIAQIGDTKFDGSLSRRLRILAEKLSEVGAREIHSGKSLVVDHLS